MKETLYFQNKKLSGKSGIILHYRNLMSGSIESMWILLSASPFTRLQYLVLIEIDEENPTSHRHAV